VTSGGFGKNRHLAYDMTDVTLAGAWPRVSRMTVRNAGFFW
jgi:hypothetical protein